MFRFSKTRIPSNGFVNVFFNHFLFSAALFSTSSMRVVHVSGPWAVLDSFDQVLAKSVARWCNSANVSPPSPQKACNQQGGLLC